MERLDLLGRVGGKQEEKLKASGKTPELEPDTEMPLEGLPPPGPLQRKGNWFPQSLPEEVGTVSRGLPRPQFLQVEQWRRDQATAVPPSYLHSQGVTEAR